MGYETISYNMLISIREQDCAAMRRQLLIIAQKHYNNAFIMHGSISLAPQTDLHHNIPIINIIKISTFLILLCFGIVCDPQQNLVATVYYFRILFPVV